MKATNFLDQMDEAARMQAKQSREDAVRITAARRYMSRHLLEGRVVAIHDSISLELPEGTHPVHHKILQAILVGGA